jgi:hypothetical protein
MPLPFSVSAPPRAAAQPPRAIAASVVVALAVLQLCIGVALLAVFEAYKVFFFTQFAPSWYKGQLAAREQFFQQQQNASTTLGGGNDANANNQQPPSIDFGPLTSPPGDPHDWRSPMAIVFLLALISNTVAIAGIAGVVHGLQQLIVAFFVYSAFATVALAHLFVDMLVDSKIDYGSLFGGGEGPAPLAGGGGEQGPPPPSGPSGYEKAAAALVFVQMLASALATLLSLRAAEEVNRRRQYKHMGDLASNLAFEPDAA